MNKMALSVAHGIDISTGTHTSSKDHIMPLNNHLNISNAMVSLMDPQHHVIAIYMTKTNMPLKCHISHIGWLVHVHISYFYKTKEYQKDRVIGKLNVWKIVRPIKQLVR